MPASAPPASAPQRPEGGRPPARPFRLAVVGVDHPHGAGWRELLRQLHSEVEVVAVVPDYAGATTSLEEAYARLPRFDSVEQLLAGQTPPGSSPVAFDGALVCLPNDRGPAVAQRLAEAGKHVLVEKPVAGSVTAATDLKNAVEQSGIAFQNGYMWRYDECAQRLAEMLRDGRFGKLISVELTYVTSDVARRGPAHYLFDPVVSERGFFNWLACHYLDLLLYVTGQQVLAVTARTGQFGATAVEVEDGGVAILELSGGGLATFIGGYWLPRWAGESHWCLRGSSRWVHWDPARTGTGGVLEIHGPQPQWHAMEESFAAPPDQTPGYGGRNGLALVRDWLAAARGEVPACRNTAQTTLDTLRLLDAIYESSASGRRVECQIP